MAIVQTVNFDQFLQAFVDMGRKDQFTYKGFAILFDYLEELSEDIGEQIELDVIGFCCDYDENHYSVIAEDCDIDLSEADGDREGEIEIVIDYLYRHTTVCGYDKETGNIVYANW